MDNTVGLLQSFLSPVDGVGPNVTPVSFSELHWMLGTGHTGTTPASNILNFQHLQPKISELSALPWCLGESLCSQACTNCQVLPQCKEQSEVTVLHHVLLLALNPPAQVFTAPHSP